MNADLAADAARRLEEGHLDARLDVGAAARATRPAEHVAEDVGEGREDVAHVGETGAAEAAASAVVAEAIVELAPLAIRQHLVGLRRLLEARLGVLVVRVAVRVKLHRELP